MALTVAKVFGPVSVGDRYLSVHTIAFDASYPTGGEALAPADLGYASTVDDEWHVSVDPAAGYVFEYDHTNKKVKAYYEDGAAAGKEALPEVSNAADLSAVTGVRVVAFGRFRA